MYSIFWRLGGNFGGGILRVNFFGEEEVLFLCFRSFNLRRRRLFNFKIPSYSSFSQGEGLSVYLSTFSARGVSFTPLPLFRGRVFPPPPGKNREKIKSLRFDSITVNKWHRQHLYISSIFPRAIADGIDGIDSYRK